MSSKVTKKLDRHLSKLGDRASKESLQTVAKWMAFNRKHAAAFPASFLTGDGGADKDVAVSRQWVNWQVLHEIMLLEKKSDSIEDWEKLLPLRTTLGEQVVIPELERMENADLLSDIKPLVEEWDDAAVFGGPLLIEQIKRVLRNPGQKKKGTTPSQGTPKKIDPKAITPSDAKPTSTSTAQESRDQESRTPQNIAKKSASTTAATKGDNEDDAVAGTTKGPSRPALLLRRHPSKTDIVFDFESTGVGAGKVEAKEFLEPCRAIATLQIARDLRSEPANHAAAVIAAIPDKVKEECSKLSEGSDDRTEAGEAGDEIDEIDEKVAARLSVQLGDDVLDLDLEEVLQNCHTFRELVQKQRLARKRLEFLLLKSRCQFGSSEAAEAFYKLDGITEKLQQRKDKLSDAMDLEGLDAEVEDVPKGEAADENALELSWYDKEEGRPFKRRKEADPDALKA